MPGELTQIVGGSLPDEPRYYCETCDLYLLETELSDDEAGRIVCPECGHPVVYEADDEDEDE